jgi:hypothetical protein
MCCAYSWRISLSSLRAPAACSVSWCGDMPGSSTVGDMGGWAICGTAGHGRPDCQNASCREQRAQQHQRQQAAPGQASDTRQQSRALDSSAGQQDEVATTATEHQQPSPVMGTTSTRLRLRRPAPQQLCFDESADSVDLGEDPAPTQPHRGLIHPAH